MNQQIYFLCTIDTLMIDANCSAMSANDIVVVSLKYSGIIRFLNLNQYKLLAIHVYTLYIILNEIKSIFDTVEVHVFVHITLQG